MKAFSDTSWWIALMAHRDTNHHKAKESLKRIKKEKIEIYVSDYVFDETVTLLRRKTNFKISHLFGENILTSKIANLIFTGKKDFQEAWRIYKKFEDQDFSFTDCTSFAIMKRLKINKALTFDRHFVVMNFDLFS